MLDSDSTDGADGRDGEDSGDSGSGAAAAADHDDDEAHRGDKASAGVGPCAPPAPEEAVISTSLSPRVRWQQRGPSSSSPAAAAVVALSPPEGGDGGACRGEPACGVSAVAAAAAAAAAQSDAAEVEHKQRPGLASASLSESLGAAAYYVLTAVGLTLFNKTIFARYGFRYPMLIVEGQLLFSLALFFVFERAGVLRVPRWSWRTAWRIVPLTTSYVLMLMTGMAGLQGTSLVMYNTLRRTSIVFVMALEYLVLSIRPSLPVFWCVLAMAGGAVIAAFGDLEFALYGYLMIVCSNVTTSLYVVLIRRAKQDTGMDNFGILFYNTVLSLPPVVLFTLAGGQHTALLRDAELLSSRGFVAVFLLACSLGFVINHAIYCNTNTNSPLTQTVSSQLKDVVLLVASAPFDGIRAVTSNLLGILVSFFGSFAYSVIKYRQVRAGVK